MGLDKQHALAAAAVAAGATTAYLIHRHNLIARQRVVLASRTELKAAARRVGFAQRIAPVPASVRLAAVSDFADADDDVVVDLRIVSCVSLDVSGNRGLATATLAVPRLSTLTHVSLARCGLAALPPCLAHLPTLTSLDVSDNELAALDGGVVAALTRLERFNAARNRLTALPPAIGRLRRLRVLGLRDNWLRELPEEIGDLKSLSELYLTNNRLTALPSTIGRCTKLRKLQASFNALRTLPAELAALPNLEMVRVACCAIERVPVELQNAPRLAWVSLAGNPITRAAAPAAPSVPHAVVPGVDELESVGAKLGDGASGDVRIAVWAGAPTWVGSTTVAVKLFHADTSPDGHPADEAALARAVDHPALARAVATVARGGSGGASSVSGDESPPSTPGDGASPPPTPGDGASAGEASPAPSPPAGLLFRVAPGAPLAAKPAGEPRVLRCRWDAAARLAPQAALATGARIAGALAALHAAGIAHGDVYAHNVLFDEPTATATLVDLGAGFFVPRADGAQSPPASAFHAFDVRAFGIFLGELAAATHGRAARVLAKATAAAADAAPGARPTAAQLEAVLTEAAVKEGVVM